MEEDLPMVENVSPNQIPIEEDMEEVFGSASQGTEAPPMGQPMPQMNGPIPGEHWTTDPRNYPWHQPPMYTDLDDCIEHVLTQMKEPEAQQAMLSMLEMKLPVAFITELIVFKGIEEGFWTIDMAILMAGPVAHFIVILARAYEVKYDMGLEEREKVPTPADFEIMQKIEEMKSTGKTKYNEEDAQEFEENTAQGMKAGGFAEGGMM